MVESEHSVGPLTDAEKKAIAALQRVAKSWPDSLWLFSASGQLWVLHKVEGQRQYLPNIGNFNGDGGGVDQAYIVAEIPIENDGGDW